MSPTITKIEAYEVTIPLPRPLLLGAVTIAERRVRVCACA